MIGSDAVSTMFIRCTGRCKFCKQTAAWWTKDSQPANILKRSNLISASAQPWYRRESSVKHGGSRTFMKQYKDWFILIRPQKSCGNIANPWAKQKLTTKFRNVMLKAAMCMTERREKQTQERQIGLTSRAHCVKTQCWNWKIYKTRFQNCSLAIV